MPKPYTRRDFIKIAGLSGIALSVGCRVTQPLSCIIRQGLIFDGTGKDGVVADIGIRGDQIVAIGNLAQAKADKVIEAQGKVVAPGFIDIHSHTDIELLVNPLAESKIQQGITTELCGNCGSSYFPMNEEDRVSASASLTEQYGIAVDWTTLAGFFERLEKQGIGINYATLTGHGDLRARVVGKMDVQPSPEQLSEMKRVLIETLEQGSFGLSTGLEYAPGSYAKTEELVELCREVQKRGGLYATHTRNEDAEIISAIEEALQIARDAQVRTEISHLKACYEPSWGLLEPALELINRARDNGLSVQADRYPYTAFSTGLSAYLPLWARQGSTTEILQRLQDKLERAKIQEHAESRGKLIGGWKNVVISSIVSEKNRYWMGRSIEEAALEAGKDPFDFIAWLLTEEECRVGIVGFAMTEENLAKVLTQPWVSIGSDGSAVAPSGPLSKNKPHPRAYGTFPRVLGLYCREKRLFPLAEVIHKMTWLPAEFIGLKQRGKIAEGFFADLVIFSSETIIDQATYVDPHQFPVGIDQVFVNGQIVVQQQEHTRATPGKVLRSV